MISTLERNPQIPQMRNLKGSYKGISELYFENFAKLQRRLIKEFSIVLDYTGLYSNYPRPM
jgi:hypothetical protein